MSTLIDQRILIPAPIHAVWSVLADQAQLPRWRVDCQTVQILTPRQFGVGMRRRCLPPYGRASLEEITAWFEGIGYEYHVIESRTYREWVGRIRLQAVPEGTIVQWTINYTMRGMIRRLLNMIGGQAQNEENCADSLRQLRRLVESLGYSLTDDPAKRRQTLQPVPALVKSSTQPVLISPQVAAADTKPRRPKELDEAIEAQKKTSPMSEPVSTPPPNVTPVDLLAPIPPPAPLLPIPEPTPSGTLKPVEKLPPGMPESLKITPPQGIAKVDISRMRYADEVESESDLFPSEGEPLDLTRTQAIRPGLPPPTDLRDTGKVSIWDAFGIKPPSQIDSEALDEIVKKSTGEYKTVTIEDSVREGDTISFSPLYRFQRLRVRFIIHELGLTIKYARAKAKVRDEG